MKEIIKFIVKYAINQVNYYSGENMTNLENYKTDLKKLIKEGDNALKKMIVECYPDDVKKLGEEKKKYLNELPSFKYIYQAWYSEALVIIKILLPNRVNDFIRFYEKQKNRKDITYENYTIEDYLQGLSTTNHLGNRVVWIDAGIPKFEQQLHILKACEKRFESSLFDIKQLLQSDVFDSELEAAKELNKKGFMRGAGAMAGVILESHFSQICEKREIKIIKKHPTINDFNELLKVEQVISIEVFRFIQYLGDLRNKCDHKKDEEPSKDEISELIQGVEKIIKTVF